MIPEIPPQLLVDMHISAQEEADMKVSKEATTKWREAYNIPNSDFIEEKKAEVSAKRERGASTVVKEPKRKAARHKQ